MYVEQIYTNCLAEASYYVESEGVAVVIDPVREPEPYIALAEKRNAKIKYVFETHFHADFVSGHLDLAQKTGATIVYGPTAKTGFEKHEAKDGEVFKIGKVEMHVLHTPGHTPESTCFLLKDESGKDYAVFTGDTLFVGDVGRPDLLDGVMTKEELASMLYDSLNNKLKPLADEVIVYPGHGPGSSCGKNIGKETFSTIGAQRKNNYAMQEMSKDEFIAKITDGLGAPPAYFFMDAKINKNGYQTLDEVMSKNLKPLSVADFKEKMKGEKVWILDTRHELTFGSGHVKGSVNIGLNGTFALWVGAVIPTDVHLLLVTEPGKEQESILRLARVGYEKILGYLDGGIEAWKSAGEPVAVVNTISAEEFEKQFNADNKASIIDVRKKGEFGTAHLTTANHVCLSEVAKRMSEFDKTQKHYVHCAGGYRSMIAVSMMQKEGFTNLINIDGGFSAISKTNMPVAVEEGVSCS